MVKSSVESVLEILSFSRLLNSFMVKSKDRYGAFKDCFSRLLNSFMVKSTLREGVFFTVF